MTIEKTYMHTGIPVPAKMEGMTYMPGLKVWICKKDGFQARAPRGEGRGPRRERGDRKERS